MYKDDDNKEILEWKGLWHVHVYQILIDSNELFPRPKERYLKNINIGVIAEKRWLVENASGEGEDGDKGSAKKKTWEKEDYLAL